MKYFNLVENSIDQYGLITKPPYNTISREDGGDSLQRESSLMICAHLLHKYNKMDENEYNFIKNRYQDKINQLEGSWGRLKRHSDKSKWYGDEDRMSRDQCAPTLMAMIMIGMNKQVIKFLFFHMLRGMLFTANTRPNWVKKGDAGYKWKMPDITFMEFWSYYIRGSKPLAKILYPILMILDIENLINSMIKVLRDPNSDNDINHINSLLYSLDRVPTIVIKLSRYIYAKRKKAAKPVHGMQQSDFGPQTALDSFCGDNDPIVPLNLIYKDIMFLLEGQKNGQ